MADSPIRSEQIPPAIGQIMARLEARGYECWLVGGCVRDLCLGKNPKDFDVATSARPEQIQQLFPHHIATGLKHGTVTVIWQNMAAEITTFRSDGTYTDSRRPDRVVFHDQIRADLARRDFTINSMAFHPERGLLDLHGGLEDIRRGILRSVGQPLARFQEDALRLLRAIRFSAAYDLTPEPQLVRAAAELAGSVSRLSTERVVMEMMQILSSPYPRHLTDFSGCGLLSAAAASLLGVTADDAALCGRLSCLIHPGVQPGQKLPLFYLAAAAYSLDAAGLQRVLLPMFRPAAGRSLLRLYLDQCRISRHMAAAGEAMLYLMNLRLLLPPDKILNPVTQCRLQRLLARRCRLDAEDLPQIAAAAGQLLRLLLNGRRTEDIANRQADPDPYDFTVPQNIPLTLSGLALDGAQLQAAGWKPGPALRIQLERLLSLVIARPELNRPESLLNWARAARSAPIK